MQNKQVVRQIDSTFFNLLYPLVTESFAKKKVMLVESDIDIASTIEAIFSEDREIELHVARDSDEAMIHMVHGKFDLVVLEDHQYSVSLHHPGYIYKLSGVDAIVEDIKKYFANH